MGIPVVYLAWRMTRLIGFQYFINQMERLACKYDYESFDYVSCAVEPDSVKCVYEKIYLLHLYSYLLKMSF